MEPDVGVPVTGASDGAQVAKVHTSDGAGSSATDQHLTNSIESTDMHLKNVYEEGRGPVMGKAAGSEKGSQIDQTGHNPYQGGELPPWEQKKKSKGSCAVQ